MGDHYAQRQPGRRARLNLLGPVYASLNVIRFGSVRRRFRAANTAISGVLRPGSGRMQLVRLVSVIAKARQFDKLETLNRLRLLREPRVPSEYFSDRPTTRIFW